MNQLRFAAPAVVVWVIAMYADSDTAMLALIGLAIILAIFGGAQLIRDIFIEDEP